MEPTILKSKSIDSPMILNGSRINQKSGNRKIIRIASGQHKTSRMNQIAKARKVRMEYQFSRLAAIMLPVL